MSLVKFTFLAALFVLVTIGCRSPASVRGHLQASAVAVKQPAVLRPENQTAAVVAVQQVAFQTPTATDEEIPPPVITDIEELSLDRLVEDVLMTHPSIEAMVATWQSAAARYPQVVSLDDPMFGAMFAPASFNSSQAESAYALELSQKFPWHGKRTLRGNVASAEADGADRDIEATRQKLVEIAALAFWDYYLVRRQLDLNQQSTVILTAFRKNAESRYQTGLVTSQDVLQAEIELANLEQRRIELDRMDKVAIGRINTLLRRGPADEVPPPPKSMETQFELPDLEMLLALAQEERPELAAAAARLRAAEATLCLAYKDYYPDTEVYGRYDTFWQPADTQSDLRGQIGVRMNVPLYRQRLNAAVCAASHQVARARAEFDQLSLDVQSDVQSAYEQVRESQRTITLFAEKLLPAAEQNVAAAQANYDTAKVNFLDLATSQRQLIEARERRLQAEVELHRRITTLRRATGGALP